MARRSNDPPRQSRISSQFGWVSGGRVLAALIQAAALVLLARSVSPSDFAFVAAAQGALIVAQTISGFGIGTFVVRERALESENPDVYSALRFNEYLSFALAAVLAILAVLLGIFVDIRYLLLLPLALSAAGERSADVWLGVAIADGDAKVNTANLVIRRALAFALFWGALQFAEVDPILGFGLSAAIAAVGSWIFARRFIAPSLARPERIGSPGRILRLSWPYWLNSVATQLRNLDVVVALSVMAPVQAGYYGLAARLTTPLRIVPTSLAAVVLPVASRETSATMRRITRLILFSCLGLSMLYGAIALVLPFLVEPLLGVAYIPAIPSLQIVTVGLVFAGLASLLTASLQGVGFKHFVTIVALLMTVTCLVGVVIGGVMAGAVGAAFGLALGYVIQCAVLGFRYTAFIVRKEPNR